MAMPASSRAALASLAWNQIRLRFRRLDAVGLAGVQRAPAHVALRMRTARTIVTGLASYSPLHTASAAGRYLMMALDAGDVSDRVRSLGFTAYVSTIVNPSGKQAATLLSCMDALAHSDGLPELVGFAALIAGCSSFHRGRVREARQHLHRALVALRGCTGVAWEIDATNVYDHLAAFHCGDYADLVRATPTLVDDAFRRGRVWAGAMMSGFAGMPAWIAPDDPDGYRRQLAEAGRHWHPRREPQWPDFVLLLGEAALAIYVGDPMRGFDLLQENQARYSRSQLTRGKGTGRAGHAMHRGRSAAAALRAEAKGSHRRPILREVLESSAVSLRRFSGASSRGYADTLEAALALDRGDQESGCRSLESAVAILDEEDRRMHSAAARRRLGQLLGGDEGAQLVHAAEMAMIGQGIRNVEAMTEFGCPGCRMR
jgi:hypothetical protein